MLKGKIISKSHNDFDKEENARIAADVKFHIQADRLRKIMEDVVAKLKVLMKLPYLFQEDGVKAMRKFLGDINTDFILKVCKASSNSSILDDYAVVSDISSISRAIRYVNVFRGRGKPSLDAFDFGSIRVSQVAHLILDSKELVEYLEKNASIQPGAEKKFLWCMENLRDIVLHNIKTTGIQQMEREQCLKDSYTAFLILAANIRELENELTKQLEELKHNYDSRLDVMYDLERQVQVLKDKHNDRVRKLVYTSEKAMMKAFNVSEERQAGLTSRMEEDTYLYTTMLAADLKEEADLRARKNKIETQLASWLAKYDQDIGEKQAELERLEKLYDEERLEIEQLREEFKDQSQEYYFLMSEKEEQEQKMLEEMMYKFVRNRAARIIQRNWKAYLARKAGRKKKKGKKGSEKKGSNKKDKGQKKDKADEYVKALEKRAKVASDAAKSKEKTLEEKYGDDMFEGLKDDNPSAFEKKE